MDNSTLQKIKDLIDKNDRIGIAVGKNPTVDAMAAALSLSLGLSEYGKQTAVVSASQPLVEHSSLVGIDKVKASFDGGAASGDLVVSFPYREGEIEKVSYTIESGYLNIVVKAGEQGLTFSESDVKFRQGGAGSGAPSLLFIVGTPHLSDLGRLFDTESLKNTAIVNIDNKPENQGYGDVPAVMMNVPSVSELVGGLLYYLGIDPNVDIAQNLLNGMNDGSNNMQDPRVSYTTFELVANLMKKGAARAQVTPAQQPPIPRPQPRMPQSFGHGTQYPRQQMPQRPMQRPGGLQRTNQMPRRDQYDQQQGAARPNYPGQYPQDPYMQPPMPRYPSQPDIAQHGYEQNDNPQPEMPRSDPQQSGSGSRYGQHRQGNQPRRDHGQNRKPPSDWLTPKVYKGSQPPEDNS
jgi:hypothetical protein